jgi:hypothetical protein
MDEGLTAEGAEVGEVGGSTSDQAEGDIVDATTEGAIVNVHRHRHSKIQKSAPRPT